MKLRLEATPEEISAKGQQLLSQLAKAVRPHAPELAHALEEATSSASPEEEHADLKHEFLRESFRDVHKLYETTLDAMVTEMGAALDARVREMRGGKPVAEIQEALGKSGFSDGDFKSGGLLEEIDADGLQALLEIRQMR